MKRKSFLAWILALAMTFTSFSWPTGMFAVTVACADTSTVTEAEELTPEVTNNTGDQDYTMRAPNLKSYLVSVSSGYMRVEYNGTEVVVEYYDHDYTLTNKIYVTAELSLFGGFYAGEDAYYLVFGQTNYDEDDDVEVIRVVKYSTSWERQDVGSLYGANTISSFEAGSLRMNEYNGYLYIRTCHLMYTYTDGLNHQANLTLVVRESDMKIIHTNSAISNSDTGYVSHSFNQFIIVDDEGYIVAADHGDGYPRSAVLFKYTTKAGSSTVSTSNSHVNVLEFEGTIGANATYASLGGLEYSSTSYLLAGNSVDQDDDYNTHTARNIFVGVVSRDDVSKNGTSLKWITDYDTDGYTTCSTPQLVKLGDDAFLLLWTVTYRDSSSAVGSKIAKLDYVFLDGEGNTTSEIYEVDGQLSDCQPILVGDEVVWYVTGDVNSYNASTEPYFYSIDLDGNYTAPETLDSPEVTLALTTSSIEVTWDAVDGAEGYTVYRLASSSSYATTYTVNDPDTTSYTVGNVSNGTKYYFWVEAYAGDTKSFVSEKKSICYLKPVLTAADGSITVSWESVSSATSYEVYRKTTGSYTKVGTTTDTSWSDTSVTGGITYTYQIRTICGDETDYSVEVSRIYLDAPALISVENVAGGMSVTWETVDGAEKYYLYRGSSYATITAGSGDTQTYSISGNSGTTYDIYVKAACESGTSVASNTITNMYLERPTVTLTTNDSDITLSWSEVTGADGYKIYRKVEGGSYSLLASTTDTSYTDTSISASTFYIYQVYAYSGEYISAGSTEKMGGTKDIADCTITLSETSYTYDGTSKRPTVTINDGINDLTYGTDYSLSYNITISVGTSSITIKGTGNYTGSTTVTYTIERADQTLTASIENNNLTCGESSQITASGKGTVTYSSSDTSVATVSSSGLVRAKNAGTATITVTADGGINYNPATTEITVTVTEESTETETETEAETEKETETETETEAEKEAEAEAETGTEDETETGTEAKTDTSTGVDVNVNTDADTSASTETNIGASTGNNTETDSSTGTGTDADTGTDTSTDTVTSTDTDRDTDTSTSNSADKDTSSGADTDTSASADTSSNMDIDLNTDADIDSTPDYTLGDINDDGFIDYLDALLALRHDAELISLSDVQVLAGDVNKDGSVDALDAILILRYDAGLIENF